jgi:hypothetical protein
MRPGAKYTAHAARIGYAPDLMGIEQYAIGDHESSSKSYCG